MEIDTFKQITEDDVKKIIWEALVGNEGKMRVTLLNLEAVANRLHKSKVTLWRWDRSGHLKAVRIGRAIWYRLEDVEELERGERAVNEGGLNHE